MTNISRCLCVTKSKTYAGFSSVALLLRLFRQPVRLELPRRYASNLPERAKAVIIGGGAVGTSTAYHLARLGMRDVVLLEKTKLTAGSTWHAAGLTALYHGGINMKKIHFNSINLFTQLELETGMDLSFHRPGSIRIATDATRMDEFRYQMQRQGWQDAPQRIITPDEIYEKCPLLNMDKVIGGLYNPYDGHIDPNSLTNAIFTQAKKFGAKFFEQTPVEGLKAKDDGTWLVQTNQGIIQTDHVINAAGFWAHEINKLAKTYLPLVPVHHQYMITTSMPEVQKLKEELPVLRHLAGGVYIRQERDGILFGPYESETKMKLCDDWVTNRVPPGFGQELFEPDLDRLSEHIDAAMELIPALKTAEIRTTVSGPIAYTADTLPCIGPMPHMRNYWVGVGFAYGIAHSGGAGRYLAEWIINEEPTYDLIETDPGRFNKWATTQYTFVKAAETYGYNNNYTYPKEERFGGRPTSRITPIYKTQLDRGAEMGFHAGWDQPAWFAQPGDKAGYKPSFQRTNWFEPMKRECKNVLENVGIIDLTPFAKINVSGPDATKFMDKIVANNLPKMHRTNISHMLTPRGRVYAELTVTTCDENKYFVITGSGAELHDLRWMQQHAFKWNMNVQFDNVTETTGCLGVAGPKSAKLLSKLTKTPLDDKNFPFLSSKHIDIGGVPVHAIRISYTGELGWELYHKMEDMPKLYKVLLDAGKELNVGDFGTYAMNSLRLEKGFRMWGAEMTMDSNPIEAGLGAFVKVNKAADFNGKEAIKKIQREGLHRRLVSLVLDEGNRIDPEGNESIWCSGKVVGYTTSGSFGVQTNRSIAMAYLPMYLTKPGFKVDVELLGKHYSATVLQGSPAPVNVMKRAD